MAGHGPDRRGWSGAETVITPANVASLTSSYSISAAPNSSEVLGDGSRIVTTGGGVQAFDPTTATSQWSSGGGASAPPALRDQTIVVPTGCAVTTRNATTGDTTGTTTFATQVVNPPNDIELCGIASSVVEDNGTFLVSWWKAGQGLAIHCGTAWFVDTEIAAFTATRQPIFSVQQRASGCGTPPSDLLTRPRFGEITRTAHHYVAVFGGNLVGIPDSCAVSCGIEWSTPVSEPIGPAVAIGGGRVAIVNRSGTIAVLDEQTGSEQWTGSIGTSATYSLGATDDSLIAVGTDTNTLYAFRTTGCGAPICSPSWQAPMPDAAGARPSIAGNVIYVGGAGGILSAYDARGCGSPTCTALTSRPVSAAVTGPVTVLFGRVFVPTATAVDTFALPS